MAKFQMELPNQVIKDIQKIYDNSEEIFGEMTRAGADVVNHNIIANVPESIRNSEMMKCLKVTKTYKTPSDDGINTKTYISGYMPFSGNRSSFTAKGGNGTKYTTTKGVPADFVAKIYEYGRSSAPFPKHPFLRKSFKKKEIEEAMLNAQKKLSGGLLDE